MPILEAMAVMELAIHTLQKATSLLVVAIATRLLPLLSLIQPICTQSHAVHHRHTHNTAPPMVNLALSNRIQHFGRDPFMR